jgi:hypothetical protein
MKKEEISKVLMFLLDALQYQRNAPPPAHTQHLALTVITPLIAAFWRWLRTNFLDASEI